MKVACAHPGICKVKTHQGGSSAGRACAAGRPRPPETGNWGRPPVAAYIREREDRKAELADLRAIVEGEHGAFQDGAVHPGGYDRRDVEGSWARGWLVIHRASVEGTSHGHLHRTDGPATIHYPARSGQPDAARLPEPDRIEYRQDNLVHRGDGPAVVSEQHPPRYSWRGVPVPDDEVLMPVATGQRREALLAAGAPADRWVSYARWDDAGAGALVAAGVDPDEVEELRCEGVRDAASAIAVLRGELPISWALAGA